MIAGILTVRDDVDVVGLSVSHLLEEGVDHVWACDGRSTDGTRETLEELRRQTRQVTVLTDFGRYHRQARWTDVLAALAHRRDGADWILPFDADELFVALPPFGSVAEALAVGGAGIGRTYAQSWRHHDWDRREAAPKPWPKVAYRFAPSARVHPGNHDVDGVPGPSSRNLIELRELQYRSFGHFCQKAAARNATIDPRLPADYGAHHRRLEGLGEEEMRQEWAALLAIPTVHDPIRSRSSYRFSAPLTSSSPA